MPQRKLPLSERAESPQRKSRVTEKEGNVKRKREREKVMGLMPGSISDTDFFFASWQYWGDDRESGGLGRPEESYS